ncbi:D-alanyl-D-alanine carboxypeptidase/D-alanyl-D-alanine-endopeptidase [Arcticibacter tournemirensis]|uniref:D-alanyl-D-alanine carboxypeptidase/D-alanyl-D-alanine-endopeptidase n=1 Tax=Arcticibacter tournemirensis TaxID=699437 RepID=A0A4Q0M5S5_9SPHI|nr:D-alanyl-D-alanine carboxypeptidase/D-alanyl-D-alanine-endopeptidase [Arcticibacter tournemirensis]RXF68314.1 D-alanyl-D-alanine carboxypeptidase/D-alanyl-D-alanine-endopeptidase [Arcticibacter tournemirensis]
MKRIFFSFCLLFCNLINNAQTLEKKIAAAYARFEADPQLKYGNSSLTVLNAQTGEIIFSRNGDTGLAPASTLKTVTSITAFNLLAEDFRWETTLGYTGTISNGVLSGDLIITGSGDPTLGSNRYEQSKSAVLLNRWLTVVKKSGIQKIQGRVIADDRLFGTQSLPQGWIWQDIGNYYGAGATSATWEENQFGLLIKPGAKTGDPVVFQGPDPIMEGLKIVNEVATGAAGSGDNVYAYSAPYSDIVYVRGTYASDLRKIIMLSVPDPALQLSSDLRGKLTQNGVLVSGEATTARKISIEKTAFLPPAVILDRYDSPELSKVIYWLNQKSLNLYAENILKTIAIKQRKQGSFAEGVEVIKDYWNKRIGLDTDAIDILDGSGLSPENRITTLAMARILQSAVKEPWYNSFYESLPLYNNMKMKSGSIRNVLAYTGYEKSADGTPLIFSFITDHYNGRTSTIRQKMFNVLDALK